MRRKFLGFISAMLAVMLITAGSSWAATVQYEFSFTGADLFNHQFVNGADGSTAADNDLYDGARLIRVGTNGGHADAGRTYIESQQSNFNDRWNQYTTDGYVFDAFNLWGLDGRGAFWGEDFKPSSWDSHDGPSGWSTGYYTWPWGNPPADATTLDFPWWNGGQDNGIAMDASQSELEALEYSFLVSFDTDDLMWGQDTQGTGSNSAPNTLPELTFWFGGWLTQYDVDGNIIDDHLYEGNMVLTGNQVPEPATMLLFGVGLLGIAGVSRRKRA